MPEFRLRFPVLGYPNPSHPALYRQATSYAWRNRLRRITLGRSDNAHSEVQQGGARRSVAAWAVRIQAGRGCPEFLAGLGGLDGSRAAPKAGRKGSTRRAIRYAQCVLEDMGAKCEGKRNIFGTAAKRPNVAHESRREIRYAQRRFVNVSALERTMLPMTRSTF